MKASVKEIQDSGKSIVLDDGSKWSISSFDAFNTRMWMRFDNIEINFNKLTNHSRGNQTVDARRV